MNDSKPIVTAFSMEVDEPGALILEMTPEEMLAKLDSEIHAVRYYIDLGEDADVLRIYAADAAMYLAAICEKFGELRGNRD